MQRSCKLDSWSLKGDNGEQEGAQEPRWWERWADLLNHWWWPVVCDHFVSLETGLTDFSWSFPGVEAPCKRAGCGGKFGQRQVMRAGWEAWLRHGGRQGQSPGESQELPDPGSGTVLAPAFGWVPGFGVSDTRSALGCEHSPSLVH